MIHDEDLPELSRAELDIMRILWDHELLSAREVHDRLTSSYDWAYSTTRTMLDRLVTKGHVRREPFHGVNVYRSEISRPEGLARLVRDFASRVLEGDHGEVVALFARGSSLSAEEVEELARLVDEASGGAGGGSDA